MRDKRKKPQVFVSDSYNRSDQWAISKVQKYLIDREYFIHEKKEEDFELDIKAEKNGKIVYFEIETKTGYSFNNESDFRFPTVSFLARKKKWASIGFWYIIVCRETLAFVMCSSKVIFNNEYSEALKLDSPERVGTDYFYRVPKNLCHWYNLES